ncbi:MAG TPA: Crp/Fnr family transcriptional regulator [Sphingomicrobium sp.]|nr:Crp/Fnr family transcriptional regulator [Sphingomicrobium sp.]
MNRTATDELDRLDEAFAGNRLLSTFPAEARALVEPFATLTELNAGEVVHTRGSQVESCFFPFGSAMVSLVLDLSVDRSIEVASIGHEGAVGGIVSCGHAPAFARAEVLVSGPALRVAVKALEDAKMRSAHIRNLFCRFSDYLLAQVMQSLACNSYHSIEQRAARWLLTAQDRAGARIELTQETLAGLLGVQRTTVNAVIRILQDEGLVSTRRGAIRVIDRAGLKKRACGCYDVLERHFAAIVGISGNGTAPSVSP